MDRGEFLRRRWRQPPTKDKGLEELLLQYQKPNGEDKPVSDEKEQKRCGGMPLMTDLALMMRIDPLALIIGLREFVTVVQGHTVMQVLSHVQVKEYRHSVLYVNLVSVADCSVLNWVEQRELRRLASQDRLFGRLDADGFQQQLLMSNGRRRSFERPVQS